METQFVALSCLYAALNKLADAGKYGVGYFQPNNCDNIKIECKFMPYPEFENLKKAYTTTKNSTRKHDSYTPTRDTILSCPKKMSTKLPPTPKGELWSSIIECSSLVEISYHVGVSCGMTLLQSRCLSARRRSQYATA